MTGATDPRDSIVAIFRAFLRLGFTSFGGPVAHLAYFRAEFVGRRRWLDEETYADIVALCQFLPGPASSQVGVSLGIMRGGLSGGLAAWCGFTLPSAIALILFAYGVAEFGDLEHAAWLHGLKIVAVAVVAQAVWAMARNLCPDRLRATLAVGAALLTLTIPTELGQLGSIGIGACVGWLFIHEPVKPIDARLGFTPGRSVAIASLVVFAVLLVALPFLAETSGSHTIELISRFYRSGSLVFGGGHVVLPLLQQSVVPPGWIGNDGFLAGYGAAQAVPGPLFTFSAYLGAALGPKPNGWLGGFVCLLAIYLPSFLLLIGVLPFWDGLRKRVAVQAALRGVNAAVVGLLLAALYTPVWTSGIQSSTDFGICIAAFLLLVFWRTPPWLVVVLGAIVASTMAA
ncbi:MAG TPA: chromate efflux transporter [Aliidongia sp.]|uniref:chromate efflux transporter n=1 Tax=Aliidongia sp. TaxID=1914230 RepID=UPI002DDCA64C|nr:chromate efflux transporter [Aliidongia sp.]HEV2678557.1 chromate efflux transporter [Aliidongia sp.]